MSANQSSNFSFDAYPGLDQELDEIYRRNVADGIAPPINPDAKSIGGVVANVLNEAADHELDKVVGDWASTNLARTLNTWMSSYSMSPEGIDSAPTRPENVRDFALTHAESLTRLYEAMHKLAATQNLAPNGENVGHQMNLVLIPWAAFSQHLEDLPEWINGLRSKQWSINEDDFIGENILKAIKEDWPMYRNPDYDPFRLNDGSVGAEWLSARDYLDEKIAEDGEWGVMLVQTSDEAGLKRLVEGPANERSPDALTNHGNGRFMIADVPVDNMGVFEWLALTLQQDPTKLSSKDVSWLLANRIQVRGDWDVPYGDFDDGQVRSGLRYSGSQNSAMRPRLAVM